MKELKESKEFEIRFSEVDSMNVVWHGSYPLYFEDAREAFGKKYGLEYMTFFDHGYFAPIVELSFHYKKPIRYGMRHASTSSIALLKRQRLCLITKSTIRKTILLSQQVIPYRFSWI